MIVADICTDTAALVLQGTWWSLWQLPARRCLSHCWSWLHGAASGGGTGVGAAGEAVGAVAGAGVGPLWAARGWALPAGECACPVGSCLGGGDSLLIVRLCTAAACPVRDYIGVDSSRVRLLASAHTQPLSLRWKSDDLLSCLHVV